jgi:hypothetical protein
VLSCPGHLVASAPTRSQILVLALAYPEPKRGMHSELKFSTEVDTGDLSRARAVCRWARGNTTARPDYRFVERPGLFAWSQR